MTEDIKDWLNSQAYWLQLAAYKTLTDVAIDDDAIGEIADVLKSPPDSPSAFEFPSIGTNDSDVTTLELNSIGPLLGIDALNPRTPLDFENHPLSVVYGHNGSGKSGYTRILKKASGKAGATELKANIYTKAPERQECRFTYTLNGTQREVTWPANSTPVEDLKSLDLFDTAAGEIYLKDETELSYTPPELSLFESLVSTAKRVEQRLNNEAERLFSKLPPLPPAHRTTNAAEPYTELKHTTRASSVFTWTEDDELALTAHNKRLGTKDPTAESKRLRGYKKQCDTIIETLTGAAQKLSKEAYLEFVSKLIEAKKARTASTESATALREGAPLDSIGTDTWKALWTAAKDYSTQEAYKEEQAPHTGENARCVLCQQELGSEAKERLQAFESYISGTLETTAAKAEKAVQDQLDALPVIAQPEVIETAAQAANIGPAHKELLAAFWQRAETALKTFIDKDPEASAVDLSEQVMTVIKALTPYSKQLEKDAAQLDADAKDFDRAKALGELKELEARKWIAEQVDAINEEIERLKKVEDYRKWIRQTNTRGISTKAGQRSETLITEAYIERFNHELGNLGARHIKVELVKSRTTYGVNKHVVRLKDLVVPGITPVDVFSEGEHRIVALAAFLADVCGRPSKTPFIFDDPITSLDQEFEEKCIDRLIELSKDRQVLVFTHRLSFLSIICDKEASTNSIQINRTANGTGDHGLIPYFRKNAIQSLNTLKDQILPPAKQQFESGNIESYHIQAKGICSEFRIQLEHIVENVLIADVIRRHRRSVTTKNRINHLSKIKLSDCTLIEDMMTKYSCFEHSQTPEAPIEIPPPDELQTDIEKMLTWHSEFKARAVA